MTPNPQRSPDFRPDSGRAIFLSDIIDQPVLDRLTPIILRLQGERRGPISLYIDSPGGSVISATVLQRIIRSPDQDGNAPCRLITVVTGTAASAASDILMGGDYALAYPHARILCHGVTGRGQQESLTSEKAYELAKDLANSNERFAIQLADNCISRFIFRVAAMSYEFPDLRKRLGSPELPPTSCFIEVVRDRLSNALVKVLENALKRSMDNDALDIAVSKALTKYEIGSMPRPQFEVLLLKTILDYEASQHEDESEWSVRSRGLELIQDKLDLLLDKYSNHHAEMIAALCTRWGELFLSPEQASEVQSLPQGDRPARIREAVGDILRTLWFFFVSVCRSLQEDDYWMSAEESYWLGLIDEVIGRTDLPCPRLFVEYPPSADDAAPEQITS